MNSQISEKSFSLQSPMQGYYVMQTSVFNQYQDEIKKMEQIIQNLFANQKRKVLIITNINPQHLSIKNKYCLTISEKSLSFIHNNADHKVEFEFNFDQYPPDISSYLPFIKNAISDLSNKKAWIVDA